MTTKGLYQEKHYGRQKTKLGMCVCVCVRASVVMRVLCGNRFNVGKKKKKVY